MEKFTLRRFIGAISLIMLAAIIVSAQPDYTFSINAKMADDGSANSAYVGD